MPNRGARFLPSWGSSHACVHAAQGHTPFLVFRVSNRFPSRRVLSLREFHFSHPADARYLTAHQVVIQVAQVLLQLLSGFPLRPVVRKLLQIA